MKLFTSCLVLCALLGLSHGQFQDSPAVAAAKAAHFEAVRRVENIIANSPTPAPRRPVEETRQHKLGLNVNDTPEVAAAKASHYKAWQEAEKASAIANSTARYPDSFEGGVQQQQQQYHVPAVRNPPTPYPTLSPTRRPPVSGSYHAAPLHQQYQQSAAAPVPQTNQHKLGVNVHETPEVASARAAHFEAFRRAEKAAAVSGPIEYEDTYVMVPSYQRMAPIVAAAPIVRGRVAAGPRFIEPMPQYNQRAHQVMYVPETYEQEYGYDGAQMVRMVPVVAVPQTNQHKLGVNVVDTPEVAEARKAHFEAFRQAQAYAAAAAAEETEEYPSAQSNGYYRNPTRQYGQVNY